MSKRILILNGSPREKGNTAGLVDAFIAGAQANGNTVTRFDVAKMNIRPCIGCMGAQKGSENPCVQKDDMGKIYPAYLEADVVVLASPMYYSTVTSQLKGCMDRLFAIMETSPNFTNPSKECVLLMPAISNNFAVAKEFHLGFLRNVGWKDIGMVLADGVGKIGDIANHPSLEEAHKLGAAIG